MLFLLNKDFSLLIQFSIMDYTGLLFEFIFLGMGIYLYLVAVGKVEPKEEQARERSKAFRDKNAKWLRPVSLALVAIMLVNIILHIMDLFAK